MFARSKYITLSFNFKRIRCTRPKLDYCGLVLVSLLSGIISLQVTAQSVSTPFLSSGHTFVPVPVVYFTPETNWAFGARVSYTFHLDSLRRRPSTLQVGGVYTLRKQFLSNFKFSLYHPEKRWELEGDAGFYKYVYKYWGIGNQNTGTRKETYDVSYPSLEITPRYILSRYWRIGIPADFNRYSRLEVEKGGELARLRSTGIDGGFVNGVGLEFQYDSRDHTIFPVKGWYVSVKSVLYNSIWGSDYSFTASELDVRNYQNIAGGIIWASQFLTSFRSGPDIPFYHLSLLGGSQMMRGYFEGRYRNQNLWALQSEMRIPVWKRFFVVSFASAGDVFDFEDYKRAVKLAGGMGLRYIVDHENRVNVRVDVAYGQNFQFYLSILEAF